MSPSCSSATTSAHCAPSFIKSVFVVPEPGEYHRPGAPCQAITSRCGLYQLRNFCKVPFWCVPFCVLPVCVPDRQPFAESALRSPGPVITLCALADSTFTNHRQCDAISRRDITLRRYAVSMASSRFCHILITCLFVIIADTQGMPAVMLYVTVPYVLLKYRYFYTQPVSPYRYRRRYPVRQGPVTITALLPSPALRPARRYGNAHGYFVSAVTVNGSRYNELSSGHLLYRRCPVVWSLYWL